MFATFPEFSKLTLKDKDEYEALTKGYPPVSDAAFAKLLCWWNPLNSLVVSKLYDNLVISYWQPGIEDHSGLSLLGTSSVDLSICTILDFLRDKNEPPRLVHVPEFVVSSLRYTGQFIFEENRDYDECIIELATHFPLSNVTDHRQNKIQQLLSRLGNAKVELKSLDLRSFVNRQILLEADRSWRRKGTLNDLIADREAAVRTAIENAVALDIENVCIYIDGELQSYLLYQYAQGKKFIFCYSFNLNYEIPGLFDLMIYQYATWFANRGVKYANVDSDLGLPLLRAFRLKLSPTNFVRKYNVKPAN